MIWVRFRVERAI